jgi:hypothetical protein
MVEFEIIAIVFPFCVFFFLGWLIGFAMGKELKEK